MRDKEAYKKLIFDEFKKGRHYFWLRPVLSTNIVVRRARVGAINKVKEVFLLSLIDKK